MCTVSLPASAVGSSFARGCTLPPPDADQRAAWHCGRRRYAVWLIEADTPEVRALCEQAREPLAPWLGQAPRRQPHITLTACGFPARTAVRTDDYDAGQRRQQRAALDAALPPAFTVQVGGIGSFNGCAYLRVRDNGDALCDLNRVLSAPITAAHGQGFMPHVTVGIYRGGDRLAAIGAASADLTTTVALSVRAVALAVYDPRAPDGPLRVVHRIALAAGQAQQGANRQPL